MIDEGAEWERSEQAGKWVVEARGRAGERDVGAHRASHRRQKHPPPSGPACKEAQQKQAQAEVAGVHPDQRVARVDGTGNPEARQIDALPGIQAPQGLCAGRHLSGAVSDAGEAMQMGARQGGHTTPPERLPPARCRAVCLRCDVFQSAAMPRPAAVTAAAQASTSPKHASSPRHAPAASACRRLWLPTHPSATAASPSAKSSVSPEAMEPRNEGRAPERARRPGGRQTVRERGWHRRRRRRRLRRRR